MLKKQLYQKEANYNRDKALWDQNSKHANKALEDMQHKLETQKKQYYQMLTHNNDSPIRT